MTKVRSNVRVGVWCHLWLPALVLYCIPFRTFVRVFIYYYYYLILLILRFYDPHLDLNRISDTTQYLTHSSARQRVISRQTGNRVVTGYVHFRTPSLQKLLVTVWMHKLTIALQVRSDQFAYPTA